MIVIIIIAVVVLLIGIFLISNYNSLVSLRNKVKDQWSQIEVVLKRRTDLIPNLVETVKGYAKHEEGTLTAVIEARNKAVSAVGTDNEIEANGELTKALGKLLAITESYPDLKANENFMDLQKQLTETEEKISFSRQFYNDSVLKYKNKLEMFPSNIVANLFNFKPEKFFEITEEERKVPEVKF